MSSARTWCARWRMRWTTRRPPAATRKRLRAYDKLRRIISWLQVPLTDPDWRPGHPGA